MEVYWIDNINEESVMSAQAGIQIVGYIIAHVWHNRLNVVI